LEVNAAADNRQEDEVDLKERDDEHGVESLQCFPHAIQPHIAGDGPPTKHRIHDAVVELNSKKKRGQAFEIEGNGKKLISSRSFEAICRDTERGSKLGLMVAGIRE